MANYAVSKQCTIPVIFLLLFIPWRPCKKSNCDLEHCSSIFQTASKDIFRRDTNHLCGNSADISECVSNCFEIFFPDFMPINSGTSIVKEICNDEFKYDLSFYWGCISKHFHSLLVCISISASMVSVNTSNTSREFSCKKALKILDCPHDVLQDCDIEAIMIVSQLFKHIFKTFMTKACFKVSSGYAYDLPAKYILDKNFLEMAACLDNLPNLASNCFRQYIKKAANYELYSCRDKHLLCERPAGENCMPLNPMNDFYIPILSFGKHLCNENELQMQDSTSVNNTSDKESETENYEKTIENTMQPAYSISSSSEDNAFHLDETESDISTTIAANTEDLYFESVTSSLNLNSVHSTPSIHPYHEDDTYTQTSYIVKESIAASGIACCSSFLILFVIVLVFI